MLEKSQREGRRAKGGRQQLGWRFGEGPLWVWSGLVSRRFERDQPVWIPRCFYLGMKERRAWDKPLSLWCHLDVLLRGECNGVLYREDSVATVFRSSSLDFCVGGCWKKWQEG